MRSLIVLGVLALAACGPATHECSAETWDHDRNPETACVAMTRCQPGAYVAAEGTSEADRVCAACPAASFSLAPNSPACTPFTVCQAGNAIALEGTATGDRTCAPCSLGTFSAGEDQETCAAWATCAPGTHVTAAGTATSDRVCAACAEGTFTDADNQASCAEWTVCAPGTFVAEEGTETSDRVCAPCGEGTFAAGTNQAECVAWTVCAEDAIQTGSPSETEDRTCAPQLTVTLEGVGPGGELEAGQPFWYVYTYGCGREDGRCEGALISHVLPAGLEVVSTAPDCGDRDWLEHVFVDTEPGTGQERVQFTFKEAGRSGAVRVQARFKNGEVQDGTVAQNTALGVGLGAVGGSFAFPVPPVTARARPQVEVEVARVSGAPSLDQPVTYRLSVRNMQSALGGLDVTALPEVTFSPPAGAIFDGASPAASCQPGCIGTSPATVTVINPCGGALPLHPGQTCSANFLFTYPSATFADGAEVNGSVSATGSLRGLPGTATLGVGTLQHTVSTFVPQPGASVRLDVAEGALRGPALNQPFRYELWPESSGNVTLDGAMMVLTLDPVTLVDGVGTGAYDGIGEFGSGEGVRIGYQKNTAPGVWSLWGFSANAGAAASFSAPAPGLGAGEYITALRWRYGTVSPEMGIVSPPFVAVRATNPDLAGGPVTVDETFEACVAFTAVSPSLTANDCLQTTLTPPFLELRLSRQELPGVCLPNEPRPLGREFSLVTGPHSARLELKHLRVMVIYPPETEPYELTFTGVASPPLGGSVEHARGTVVWASWSTGQLLPGQALKVSDHAWRWDPGAADLAFAVSYNPPIPTPDYWDFEVFCGAELQVDVDDLDQDGQTDDLICFLPAP